VDDGDLVSKAFREGVCLPPGWAQARVGSLEVQEIVDVFQKQAARIALGVFGGKLGVETHVRALRVVVKLAVNAESCLRPDFFEKQALAPAGVGDDGIGRETPGLEPQRRAEARLAADYLGLEVGDPGVDVRGRAPCRSVRKELYTLPLSRRDLLHRQRDHGVAALHERRGEVLELAGEVLVNQEDFHTTRLIAGSARPQAAASLPRSAPACSPPPINHNADARAWRSPPRQTRPPGASRQAHSA